MVSFLPFSGVRADNLEQLFRVKVCESVDPGFLTTVEILRRKVAWNVQDFFWIYDPIHTLVLVDEFGFVSKNNLSKQRASLWHLVRKR